MMRLQLYQNEKKFILLGISQGELSRWKNLTFTINLVINQQESVTQEYIIIEILT